MASRSGRELPTRFWIWIWAGGRSTGEIDRQWDWFYLDFASIQGGFVELNVQAELVGVLLVETGGRGLSDVFITFARIFNDGFDGLVQVADLVAGTWCRQCRSLGLDQKGTEFSSGAGCGWNRSYPFRREWRPFCHHRHRWVGIFLQLRPLCRLGVSLEKSMMNRCQSRLLYGRDNFCIRPLAQSSLSMVSMRYLLCHSLQWLNCYRWYGDNMRHL